MTHQPSALAALQPCPFCGASAAPDNYGGIKCTNNPLCVEGVDPELWNKRAAWPTQAQGEALAAQVEGYWYDSDGRLLRNAMTGNPLGTDTEFVTHPSPSTAADDPDTCVLCKCRLPDAALREALEPFVKFNSSEETITITVKTSDVKRARTLLAGDNRG